MEQKKKGSKAWHEKRAKKRKEKRDKSSKKTEARKIIRLDPSSSPTEKLKYITNFTGPKWKLVLAVLFVLGVVVVLGVGLVGPKPPV